MRLTVLFLTVALIQASAEGYSQEKITLSKKDASIESVFKDFREQTGYDFLYSNSVVYASHPVSIHLKDAPLHEALNQCMENQPLTYHIINKTVVVEVDHDKASQAVFHQMEVSGKVTDEKGNPLVGVSVLIKGTNNGTITDASGQYSIEGAPAQDTLTFSIIGYKKKEIPINGQTTINVTLSQNISQLDQLVVVGYGTQVKQDITGAVSTADLKTYGQVPVNNIIETLKGTIPGLNVGGINTAGGVGSISIRGQNSISASNSPLIVLDGVIYNGSLGDISPFDIKSVSVLKDASAAAIYGSRSSNGVILIETKDGSGINGKPKFNVNLDYGISNQLRPLATYGPKGYINRLFNIRKAEGESVDPSKIPIYLQPDEAVNYNATPNHKPTIGENPSKLFIQPAYNRKANISISNRTARTRYFISTSLTDQHGVVLNDDFKQVSARVNLQSTLTNWFTVSTKNSYVISNYSGSSPSISQATQLSPWASMYNKDGSYKEFPQTTTSVINPFWGMATDDQNIQNQLTNLISGQIKIPWVQGLSYTINFSNSLRWNYTHDWYNNFTTIGTGVNGLATGTSPHDYDMLLDNIIHYNHSFGEKNHVDLTLLYSREKNTTENMTILGRGYDNQALGYYGIENAQTQQVSNSATEVNDLGEMARLTYTYSDKYTLTGTIRRDGYSEFSKNKKWGVFPSLGVNWNITGENFMKNVSSIDHLDLRASYGTTGNQSIQPYSTLATVSTNYYIFYNPPATTVLTQSIHSLANNNLTWESVMGADLGIDFDLFRSRISGSIDLYNKNTHNLLFNLPLPAASGAGSILGNAGKINNKGIEIALHTQNIERKDFQWQSDVAFSLNRNKVERLLGTGNLISAGLFIGKPLNTIYDYKVTGMWQEKDEKDGAIMAGMHSGDYKLEDVNHDGKISSDSDRLFLGNGNPNFSWSWTNTFTYKRFSLMVYLYSVWGGNGYYLSGSNVPYMNSYTDVADVNLPIYDYWTPDNPNALFPGVLYRYEAAYKGVKYFDRSFIKLQKIALSYNLTPFVHPFGINDLLVTLSADNLLTYAPHWVGLDPETNSGLNASDRPSIRTYMMSLSFNF